MGVGSKDAITGKPIYDNTSKTQSDLQAAADYAAANGPNSVQTFADLAAVENKRSGMLRVVLDTKSAYIYLNVSDGWVPFGPQYFHAPAAAIAGTAWDGKSPLITKTGSAVVTSSAGGVAALTWPGGAFPNGVFSVSLTNGDNSAFGGPVNVFATTLSQLQVVPKLWTGANATSVAFRVNYIAYGW